MVKGRLRQPEHDLVVVLSREAAIGSPIRGESQKNMPMISNVRAVRVVVFTIVCGSSINLCGVRAWRQKDYRRKVVRTSSVEYFTAPDMMLAGAIRVANVKLYPRVHGVQ
jgi:hypothetical protein